MTAAIRLDRDDMEALRREARRRAEAGEADRVNLSALVREALRAAPWRTEAR